MSKQAYKIRNIVNEKYNRKMNLSNLNKDLVTR
jgi:hypothetical protein